MQNRLMKPSLSLYRFQPGHWLFVCAVILLSGCGTLQKAPETLSTSEKEAVWQQTLLHQANVKQWGLSGRLGLRIPGRSGSLSLNWSQNHGAYTLLLEGPFGQSIATIKGGKYGVVARVQGQDKPVSGPDAEAVMMRVTGWDLPVSYLQYWARGIPVPEISANVTLNDQGVADRIIQQGWTVNYAAYRKESGRLMPSRLKVSKDAISLVLSISQWTL